MSSIVIKTCSCWQVSYCTSFWPIFTRGQVSTCRTTQIFIVQVYTSRYGLLCKCLSYKCTLLHMSSCGNFHCTRGHVDAHRNVQMFIVHRHTFTHVLLYKFGFYTCTRWRLSHCNFLNRTIVSHDTCRTVRFGLTRVHCDTCRTVHIFIVQGANMTRVYSINGYGHVSTVDPVVVYKFLMATYPRWQVWHCSKCCCISPVFMLTGAI